MDVNFTGGLKGKKGRCVGSVVVVKGGLVVVLIVNGTREWSFSHGG